MYKVVVSNQCSCFKNSNMDGTLHFESREEAKNKAIEISEKLKNIKVTVKKEIMENGNLYGSVTIKEICNEILNTSNIEIKAEQIELTSNIKSKGEYKFTVNLHAEVQSEVSLEVASKE